MSDRVPLTPARRAGSPPLALSGVRPPGVPQAPYVPARGLPGTDAPGLRIAGAALGMLGEKLIRDETERAADAAKAEPLERDTAGRLVIPDLEPSFISSIPEEQARLVRASRYASEFALSSQKELVDLRVANNTPELFDRAVSEWRQGRLASIPEGVRGVFAGELDRTIDEHRRNLAAHHLSAQRQGALQASVTLIERLSGEAYDLIAAGRDPDAAAPDGPLARSVAKLRADTAAGVIPPATAMQLERELTVVRPAAARIQRAVMMAGPAAAGEIIESLRVGPAAGRAFDPAWAVLTPEERAGLSAQASQLVQVRRANESYARAEGQRVAAQQESRLAFEAQAIRHDIVVRQRGRATLAQQQRLAEIDGTVRQLSEARGDLRGMSVIEANQRLIETIQAQRGRDAVDQDAIDRARRALEAVTGADEAARREVESLMDGIKLLPLGAQATILGREAQDRAGLARDRAKAIEAAETYGRAAAFEGPQVPNNAENQAIAARHIEDLTGMVLPGGRQISRTEAIVLAARAGAVPERLIGQAVAAIQTRDASGFEGAAALHEAMMRDPRARDAWIRAAPEPLRAALDGVATSLALLRPDDPTYAQQRESIRTESLARLRGEKFGTVAAARASLGVTPTEQDKALVSAVDSAWSSSAGWFAGEQPMSPQMRQQMNTMTLLGMRHHGSVEASARAAATMVRSGFAPTSLGLSPGIGLGAPAAEGDGLFGGVAKRWVRKDEAPETYVAMWGQGSSFNSDWIAKKLPELLKEAGGPDVANLLLRPGFNAWLMPSPSGPGRFEVWRAHPRNEALVPIGVVRGGVETALPAVVDLRAKAEQLTREHVERQLRVERERKREEIIRHSTPLRDTGPDRQAQ